MTRLIFIFLLLTNVVFAQPNEKIQDDFVNEYAMKPENVLAQYSAFDFSNIWTQTKNYNILGIIGLEHQRLKINSFLSKNIPTIRTPISFMENLG